MSWKNLIASSSKGGEIFLRDTLLSMLVLQVCVNSHCQCSKMVGSKPFLLYAVLPHPCPWASSPPSFLSSYTCPWMP